MRSIIINKNKLLPVFSDDVYVALSDDIKEKLGISKKLNFYITFTQQELINLRSENSLLLKKFRTKQKLGYRLLSNSPSHIDTSAEYFIDCFAPACDNLPVIARCDGKTYEGNNSWVVSMENLIEIH